jgi:hypothetical protein
VIIRRRQEVIAVKQGEIPRGYSLDGKGGAIKNQVDEV